jgi:glycosyltransferase involved in cell wall biosynthesis
VQENNLLSGDIKRPVVSVVIPTYNRANQLKEALESVFVQTGIGDQFEIEVIVIDDGSSDNTTEVVRGYPDLQYLRLDKNRGPSAARNAGIKVSRGKYVAFLDDDDLWLSHKLSLQIATLEKNPEVGGLYGQIRVQDGDISSLLPPATRAPSGHIFQACLLEDVEDLVQIPTLIVRRDAFEKAGYFDENLKTQEHFDMFLRLAFYVPFIFLPGEVAILRATRHGTWGTSIINGAYQETYPCVIEKALAMLPRTLATDELRRKARAAAFSNIVRNLAMMAERKLIGFRDLHAYIVTNLEQRPRMISEMSVRAALARSASRLARGSKSPIVTVHGFCAEVRAAAKKDQGNSRVAIRRLMGDVWVDVAKALGSDSLFQYKAAGNAALRAVFYNPTKLAHRAVWRSIFLAGAGRRAELVLGVLRRCLLAHRNNAGQSVS